MQQLLRWKWELAAPWFGVAMTLAFAPYDLCYLALPALALFFGFCGVHKPSRAALIGYLWGLGLFGSGIWWVYVSIHDFGGADPVSSAALTLLLVGLWSLFPALTALGIAKLSFISCIGLRVAGGALLWVLVEYLRGYWLLHGFPWLQVAYSQLHTPLAGFAPLFGVYGVGFLLVLSAALLVELLRTRCRRIWALALLVAVWGAGWALQGIAWTQAGGPPIEVALIQGNIDQQSKWVPLHRLDSLRRYHYLTEQHWNADVIVWPETAIPAFLSEVKSAYLEPLSAAAREHGADLIVSLPTEGQGKDYYNSVMTLGANEALYHKNHLLPFGEYLPLQPLSGWVLDKLQIPLGDFAAGGDRQALLTAGGYPFVATICYEDAFGELVARQVEQAAYLVNVTNDAWFGDSAEPYQHMQMAQMRALETGRYLLRATNTGLTGIVGPDGRLLKQAPLFTTTALTGSITPMSGLTPYARMGDSGVFAILVAGVLLMMAWDRYIAFRMKSR